MEKREMEAVFLSDCVRESGYFVISHCVPQVNDRFFKVMEADVSTHLFFCCCCWFRHRRCFSLSIFIPFVLTPLHVFYKCNEHTDTVSAGRGSGAVAFFCLQRLIIHMVILSSFYHYWQQGAVTSHTHSVYHDAVCVCFLHV
uniref:Uncharacterized protein n=1 Tax=Trypanosoma congolense (strain IL3000) TaxID=1068625 RepID=G0UQJ1_TRYCI|nr:hypothetical protein, unlikely [Trypanosoma congolense IL3000]